MTLIQRLFAKIKISENGCWLWQASILKSGGYGQISFGGKPCRAHVVAYELFNGPVPEGCELDHLCRTPACVNPEHLDPVTHRENLLRAPSSIPAINSRKTHCVKGHPYDSANTYLSKLNQRRCRMCHSDRMRRTRSAKGTFLGTSEIGRAHV